MISVILSPDAAFYRALMDTTEPPICTVKLDRCIFTAEARHGDRISTIPGYEVAADFRPRPQGKIATYSRVRKFRSASDESQIMVQYRPVPPWCRPLRATHIADDLTGITRAELDAVLSQCSTHRFSLIELAFDFQFESGVSPIYVQQHARFGKSQWRRDRGGDGQLRYGGRRSTKLVRCYYKAKRKCYRIELELHSALLRGTGVCEVREFGRLYRLVPSHFSFATILWKGLERHLYRRFGQNSQVLLEQAQNRAKRSLRMVLHFLRKNGITNPHRFLRPLCINRQIKAALRKWLDEFCRTEDQDFVSHP